MGSWTDLDAVYPPGRLTPATVVLLALTYLRGTPQLPQVPGLPFAEDVHQRAKPRLADLTIEAILEEAAPLLTPTRRRVLAGLLQAEPEADPQRLSELLLWLGHPGPVLPVDQIHPLSELFPQ